MNIAYLTHTIFSKKKERVVNCYSLFGKSWLQDINLDATNKQRNETASFRNDEVILTRHAHLKGVTILFDNLHGGVTKQINNKNE